MNMWLMTQGLVDVLLIAGVISLWIRLTRPTKDDPRLSRGLQLLQSKITVLEDLSDRTETQAQQITALLENKIKQIQEKISSADLQLSKVDQSLKKSLEVTEIFQDRIPHHEIIERQKTIKYVKAAKMAHDGRSLEEISKAVDLQIGEIEFIAKVNKNQLTFDEDDLPSWASKTPESSPSGSDADFETPSMSLSKNPKIEVDSVRPDEPVAAPTILSADPSRRPQTANKTQQAKEVPSQSPKKVPASETLIQNGRTLTIKPFEFKKIDLNGNLS